MQDYTYGNILRKHKSTLYIHELNVYPTPYAQFTRHRWVRSGRRAGRYQHGLVVVNNIWTWEARLACHTQLWVSVDY